MTARATQATGGHGPQVLLMPPFPVLSAADEANHRIANSLQLLSAMIAFEARGMRDPAGLAALETTRRRVAAIAGVHRQLYQAPEAGTVDLADYLERLSADLGEASAGRNVFVSAASVAARAEEATAVGVIVAELVTNAFKYAYGAADAGDVWISLREGLTGGYVLQVEDRGRGLGAGVIGTGLGAGLVRMMAARLGGECDYQDARPGTRFTLKVGAA